MWWILHAAKNFLPAAAITPAQPPPPASPGPIQTPYTGMPTREKDNSPLLKLLNKSQIQWDYKIGNCILEELNSMKGQFY